MLFLNNFLKITIISTETTLRTQPTTKASRDLGQASQPTTKAPRDLGETSQPTTMASRELGEAIHPRELGEAIHPRELGEATQPSTETPKEIAETTLSAFKQTGNF